MKKINIDLVFNLLFPLLVNFVISMLLGDFSSYYSNLNSLIYIPSILFPIVWSILYLIIGYVSYKLDELMDVKGIKIFYIQLLLNVLWTPLFFGLHLPIVSAIDILILLGLCIYMLIYLFKNNNNLACLWILYVIWLAFATLLNISIAILN